MPYTFVEPPNHLEIDSLYAYISVDEKGKEGVCAAPINGHLVPLVTADEKRVVTLKRYAEVIDEVTEQQIRLVKFSKREDIEIVSHVKKNKN